MSTNSFVELEVFPASGNARQASSPEGSLLNSADFRLCRLARRFARLSVLFLCAVFVALVVERFKYSETYHAAPFKCDVNHFVRVYVGLSLAALAPVRHIGKWFRRTGRFAVPKSLLWGWLISAVAFSLSVAVMATGCAVGRAPLAFVALSYFGVETGALAWLFLRHPAVRSRVVCCELHLTPAGQP
uniref:Uncharacterized protein n=1 Tax=Marseillevirus LCMAC103 TaxID=2506604 RepID=A0A481YW88_9VIRU|nr:MAG: hypothetical protein LCMAC103_01180 [Marseillevirus LCMAC103]